MKNARIRQRGEKADKQGRRPGAAREVEVKFKARLSCQVSWINTCLAALGAVASGLTSSNPDASQGGRA